MLKINKKVEYALIALKYIAEQSPEEGRLVTAREICDLFNTPFDTTAKVLQKMNTYGILSSVKGIRGGYGLERSLSKITFKEISYLIEGEKSDNICFTARGLCECYENCNIKGPVTTLNQKVNDFLSNLTLDQFLMDRNFPSLYEGVDEETYLDAKDQQ